MNKKKQKKQTGAISYSFLFDMLWLLVAASAGQRERASGNGAAGTGQLERGIGNGGIGNVGIGDGGIGKGGAS